MQSNTLQLVLPACATAHSKWHTEGQVGTACIHMLANTNFDAESYAVFMGVL